MSTTQTDKSVNSIVYNIPMSEIFSDPTFNCRGSIAPIDVVDLSRDIEKHGLQYAILLRPLKAGEVGSEKYKYKIISGHRRHMAFRVLNRNDIPATIREDVDEEHALFLNLAENIHRRELNILQEAKALERLKLSGFSVIEVAQELGKSPTWVYVRYELLELPPEIQEAAAAGFISNTHIRNIFKVKGREKQLEMARKIKEAAIRGEKVPSIPTKKKDIYKKRERDRHEIFEMQDHIQQTVGNNFGTRCLAWAAGEISDLELYHDIQDIAFKSGKDYEIPSTKLSDML